MTMGSPTCSQIISRLNLQGNPEGGYFVQTLRDSSIVLSKSHLPSRYKVDRPVFELYEDGNFKLKCVGPDLLGEDQQPQYTVPQYVWFSLFPTKDFTISTDGAVKVHKAEPRDAENHYSLLGATCAPGFQIEDAEGAKRAEFVSRFPHLEPLISLLTLPD